MPLPQPIRCSTAAFNDIQTRIMAALSLLLLPPLHHNLCFFFFFYLHSSRHVKYFGSDLIKCKDGSKSFRRDRVNDDFCDCVDGTDEPGTSACASGKFYCRNLGSTPRFLFSSHVNDHICGMCFNNMRPPQLFAKLQVATVYPSEFSSFLLSLYNVFCLACRWLVILKLCKHLILSWISCADCCDGSDEYDGAVYCPNTCVMGAGIAYKAEFHHTNSVNAIQAKESKQSGKLDVIQNLKVDGHYLYFGLLAVLQSEVKKATKSLDHALSTGETSGPVLILFRPSTAAMAENAQQLPMKISKDVGELALEETHKTQMTRRNEHDFLKMVFKVMVMPNSLNQIGQSDFIIYQMKARDRLVTHDTLLPQPGFEPGAQLWLCAMKVMCGRMMDLDFGLSFDIPLSLARSDLLGTPEIGV
ncbi:LOW QUALITY PROTEIN: hypothetical protein Cgig2_008355 [Carnegiea gigantea]|uniref:Glucosidase II beta subunit N-terminal domain-containing protein n=1 Tax=Carnegiea gigantea TaxID=171969 RepID=A0A9Q1KB27_9CARY|nr:LOW QUALITY PROTEIN: hypothetical protein Cgig2_008355 [Carnegiea gigantea]